MKESKGVYVTKRDLKESLFIRNYDIYSNNVVDVERDHIQASSQEGRTTGKHNVCCQFDYRKGGNTTCTCRKPALSSKYYHQETNYFRSPAKQIYRYNRSQSVTDIGVGSIKAVSRKKVKRIYLPETCDRGVGSTDVLSYVAPRFEKIKVCNFYGNKKTSSKCIGGLMPMCLEGFGVSEKLSPIVCMKTKETSPLMSFLNVKEQYTTANHGIPNEKTEASTNIQNDTDETRGITSNKGKEKILEVPVQNVRKSKLKFLEALQNNQVCSQNYPVTEKTILTANTPSEIDNDMSSDSLVQQVHNLEIPCTENPSKNSNEIIENKLEKEYKRIFSIKSKEYRFHPVNTVTDTKSTSALRRRFGALRRGLLKKDSVQQEDNNMQEVILNKTSSHDSIPSHKDASVASDPPSLESRSFSSTKIYGHVPSHYHQTSLTKPQASFKKSYIDNKNDWSQLDEENDYNGVKGMFKIFGKKFNFEDESYRPKTLPKRSLRNQVKIEIKKDSVSKWKPKPKLTINERESDECERTQARKFFFFKKNKRKSNVKETYKSKKGVTAGRCEVQDGLVMKVTKETLPSQTAITRKIICGDEYDNTLRRAWLEKFMSSILESQDDVQIRWNNQKYKTSSSTVFELMDTVYRDTGIIFRSKSEIRPRKATNKKSNKIVNYLYQDIKTYMVSKIIPENLYRLPLRMKSNPESTNKFNDLELRILDHKWTTQKLQALSRKVEVVLHSRNFVKLEKCDTTSKYLRINIPKGFFSNTSFDESYRNHHNSSDEEVYKIVEYDNTDYGCFDSGKINFDKPTELNTITNQPIDHREVMTQDSNVYFPKRCDVIGVGIITQRDLRDTRKQKLKIKDDYSNEATESKALHITKKCELAESYLHDCLNMTPLGFSDSHVKCGLENNSFSQRSINIQVGSESKSCLNRYENYQASQIVSPLYTSPNDSDCKFIKKRSFSLQLLDKLAAKSADTDSYYSRKEPKDSLEVFKKRKLYSCSNKSKWIREGFGTNPCSLPSKGDKEGQARSQPKVYKKHVSLSNQNDNFNNRNTAVPKDMNASDSKYEVQNNKLSSENKFPVEHLSSENIHSNNLHETVDNLAPPYKCASNQCTKYSSDAHNPKCVTKSKCLSEVVSGANLIKKTSCVSLTIKATEGKNISILSITAKESEEFPWPLQNQVSNQALPLDWAPPTPTDQTLPESANVLSQRKLEPSNNISSQRMPDPTRKLFSEKTSENVKPSLMKTPSKQCTPCANINTSHSAKHNGSTCTSKCEPCPKKTALDSPTCCSQPNPSVNSSSRCVPCPNRLSFESNGLIQRNTSQRCVPCPNRLLFEASQTKSFVMSPQISKQQMYQVPTDSNKLHYPEKSPIIPPKSKREPVHPEESALFTKKSSCNCITPKSLTRPNSPEQQELFRDKISYTAPIPTKQQLIPEKPTKYQCPSTTPSHSWQPRKSERRTPSPKQLGKSLSKSLSKNRPKLLEPMIPKIPLSQVPVNDSKSPGTPQAAAKHHVPVSKIKLSDQCQSCCGQEKLKNADPDVKESLKQKSEHISPNTSLKQKSSRITSKNSVPINSNISPEFSKGSNKFNSQKPIKLKEISSKPSNQAKLQEQRVSFPKRPLMASKSNHEAEKSPPLYKCCSRPTKCVPCPDKLPVEKSMAGNLLQSQEHLGSCPKNCPPKCCSQSDSQNKSLKTEKCTESSSINLQQLGPKLIPLNEPSSNIRMYETRPRLPPKINDTQRMPNNSTKSSTYETQQKYSETQSNFIPLAVSPSQTKLNETQPTIQKKISDMNKTVEEVTRSPNCNYSLSKGQILTKDSCSRCCNSPKKSYENVLQPSINAPLSKCESPVLCEKPQQQHSPKIEIDQSSCQGCKSVKSSETVNSNTQLPPCHSVNQKHTHTQPGGYKDIKSGFKTSKKNKIGLHLRKFIRKSGKKYCSSPRRDEIVAQKYTEDSPKDESIVKGFLDFAKCLLCNSPPHTTYQNSSQACDDSGEQNKCIRLNSREIITVRLKTMTASTEEIREECNTNFKVKDEDGRTIVERKDYKNRVVEDMYTDPNVHRLSTNMKCVDTKKSYKEVAVQESQSESIANLVEIHFKLKVTHGDKTTEVNIGDSKRTNYDGDNKEEKKNDYNPQEVYLLRDQPSQPIDVNSKNDVNIRIVIKNFKPKSDKRICQKSENIKNEEFSRIISEKFQTVSTGYSDILFDEPTQDTNAFSVHRATIDLASSMEKSQTQSNSSSGEVTDIVYKSETSKSSQNGNFSECKKSNTTDEGIATNKTTDINKIISNIKEPLNHIKNLFAQESHTRTSATGTGNENRDTIKEISSRDSLFLDEVLTSKPRSREDKKEAIKKLFEKASEIKNNEHRMKHFRDKIKLLLESDSSDCEETNINGSGNDITLESSHHTLFKDTDSVAMTDSTNRSEVDGGTSSTKADVDDTVKKYINYCKSLFSDKIYSESSKNSSKKSPGCVCNDFAKKLNICGILKDNHGGCCCRKPQMTKDEEGECDLEFGLDRISVNFKPLIVDVATQYSKTTFEDSNINNNIFTNNTIANVVPNSDNIKPHAAASPYNITKSSVYNEAKKIQHIEKFFSPNASEVKYCEMKKHNGTTLLGISDEDKIIVLQSKPTAMSLEARFIQEIKKIGYCHGSQSRFDDGNDINRVKGDVLQSYEAKKAVLEIYAEKSLSDEDEHLVAKLPKFTYGKKRCFAEF